MLSELVKKSHNQRKNSPSYFLNACNEERVQEKLKGMKGKETGNKNNSNSCSRSIGTLLTK